MHRQEAARRRSRLRGIAGSAITMAAILCVAIYSRASGHTTVVIPWFLPATGTLLFVIATSVAFLAFGRYEVTWDTASFWVGIGSFGFAVAMLFNMLTFPGLLPQGGQFIGRHGNTAGWEGTFALWWLGTAFLLAAALHWPGQWAKGVVNWRVTITAVLFAIVALHPLFVIFEEHLPLVIAPDGSFTPLFRTLNGLGLGIVSGVGTVLSIRRSLRTADPTTAFIAVCQLAFLAVAVLSGMEVHRWDLFWYVQRLLWVGGFVVMFFGLLTEYVNLYRLEREKTEELAATTTALSKREEELRKARDHLELRVQERTEELTRALSELKSETEERVHAVEELRVREQMLMQQNRLAAMGEMLVNISHQWRQPLNVVGLLFQNLDRSYDRGTLTREVVEKNVSRGIELVEHLSKTIDDFTRYLSPDRVKTSFDAGEVVEQTVSMVAETLLDIEVVARREGDRPVPVTGHRNEFAQVLINILINARDAFRERGTESPRIEIRAFGENGRSVVTIADNAGGIAPDVIDRIFDPYFTTKPPDKGTGIGLFMSRSIIEKSMGGRLTVRNTDAGAEFRIEV